MWFMLPYQYITDKIQAETEADRGQAVLIGLLSCFLKHPRTTCPGVPVSTGHSPINRQSIKCLTDLPKDQSDGGSSSSEFSLPRQPQFCVSTVSICGDWVNPGAPGVFPAPATFSLAMPLYHKVKY